jgi:hypothetical protein
MISQGKASNRLPNTVLLSLDDLNRLIARAPLYMLAGFVLIGVEWIFGVGVLSAFGVFGLGVLLACFTDYRSERGLWMLALLYGGLILGCVCVAEVCTIADLVCGAQPSPWHVAVDFAIFLRCQWTMVRALIAVVIYNRRLSSRCN